MAFALWIIENYTIDFSPSLLTKKVNFCFNTNRQILKAILLSEVEFYSFGQFLKLFDTILLGKGEGEKKKGGGRNLVLCFLWWRKVLQRGFGLGLWSSSLKNNHHHHHRNSEFYEKLLQQLPFLFSGCRRVSRPSEAPASGQQRGALTLISKGLPWLRGQARAQEPSSGFPDPLPCIGERKWAPETLIVKQFSVQKGVCVFFSPHSPCHGLALGFRPRDWTCGQIGFPPQLNISLEPEAH